MAWERSSVRLECGCDGAGKWETTYPGDEQTCTQHGTTEVRRVGRVTYK